MRQVLSLITIAWRLELFCSEQTLTVADLKSKCISPFHAINSFNIPDFLLNELRIKLGPSHPWLQLARKTQDLTTTNSNRVSKGGTKNRKCGVPQRWCDLCLREDTLNVWRTSPLPCSWLVNSQRENPDLFVSTWSGSEDWQQNGPWQARSSVRPSMSFGQLGLS